MKILIAADMEGISGVTHWDQVTPGHVEYERFRRIMTADVNAAIRGVFEAGADEVSVTDGHWNDRNILIEELDPRARLNSGGPLSMVQGVDFDVSGAMFVGYHARMGAPNAVLDHTWSDERVANVWLNGQVIGEIGLNAAVCGHFDVPVILISGDQTACAEAVETLGAVEVAVVKQATGRMTAECLPLAAAHQKIQDAAARAVKRLRLGQAPQPFRAEAPITLAIEFMQSEMADRALLLPGARRPEGKRIEITAEDMPAAYQAFRAAVVLAKG
ncbi:MAG TPA: M55 family metallopeptidase [Anaerolineae bacterium]|nr:M55 family metallopeptidase [Anaerolineae bacterium]